MDSEVMCDPILESPRHRGSQKKGSVSPTRYSRLNEKKDLANLNDRLACYIDRVRSLESENRILLAEVSSIEEKHVREVSSLKDLYERELCDTRKLVDELSREKAKLEIDSRRLFSDLQQCKSDFDKKVEEANTLNSSVTLHEQRLAEANKLCNLLQSENRKLSDENKVLLEEKARLLGQLNDARRVLEEETLCRVELENALQTAREEFTFNEQLYEQKLMETKKKVEVELTQFDGKLNEEYEERLYHNLQEIREQYELDLENNKEDIKKMYEEKLIGLNNQLTRANNVSTMAMDEIKNMQAKIDLLNMKIVSVEKDRNAAVKKTNELEKELEVARNKYIEEYRIQQDELNKLREEMVHQLQEYQGLMDIKTALDLEIAAYRKLLEGEEARLNITPHSTPGGTRKILKGKRKHASSFEQTEEMFSKDYSFNSNSKCEVYISEISGEGQFIKLENKSDTDIPIGRWQLCQKTVADDIIFEFNAKMTIKPYGSITVWSEGIGPIPANDPNSLVMKGKKWVKADKMRVTLINQDDEEMASADNTKLNKSIKVLSRHSDRSYYGSSMQSDSNTSFNGEERCSIM